MSAADVQFDTSVVMRLLVGMPITQFRAATDFLDHLKNTDATAGVSDLVLAEAYFAMQQFYHFSKTEALMALHQFTQLSEIMISPHALQILSMPNLASAKPGFVDRLIHGVAVEAGQALVTFEKAGKNLSGTVVLGS